MKQQSVNLSGNPYINLRKMTLLKKMRLAKKISMVELAKAVGISHGKLGNIENGQTYVSPELLERLAAELNTEVEVISEGLITKLLHKNVR